MYPAAHLLYTLINNKLIYLRYSALVGVLVICLHWGSWEILVSCHSTNVVIYISGDFEPNVTTDYLTHWVVIPIS